MAERCRAPSVPHSGEGARTLRDHDDRRRSDVALTLLPTATQHKAQALSRRPSVPGIGPMVRVVVREALPALTRFPRLQDGGSSCRVVTGAKESAGKREGTAGPTIGHAARKWAFSAAAVVDLRHNPAGHTSLAR